LKAGFEATTPKAPEKLKGLAKSYFLILKLKDLRVKTVATKM